MRVFHCHVHSSNWESPRAQVLDPEHRPGPGGDTGTRPACVACGGPACVRGRGVVRRLLEGRQEDKEERAQRGRTGVSSRWGYSLEGSRGSPERRC